MILRGLPAPFFGSLAVFIFLLLMQFLMRYLPDLVGKGLPLGVIIELIAYNLAYMVVLAVPMSVLISTLAAFARLAESRAYVVIKSAGISLPEIMWPVVLLGFFLMNFMFYFNHVVLPEANFQARNLWQDIRRKKPGFELQPGVFYDGLRGYSIRADQISQENNSLAGVKIFDYTQGSAQTSTIVARRGRIAPLGDGSAMDLYLEEGEVHRYREPSGRLPTERYERLAFQRHRMHLDLSDFTFERSDPTAGARTDRTMPTRVMARLADSLKQNVANRERDLREMMSRGTAANSEPEESSARITSTNLPSINDVEDKRLAVRGLAGKQRYDVFQEATQRARDFRSEIESAGNMIRWETQRLNRYRVEIHKKYAIAFACLIFIFIGAPLGLSVQRSGPGIVGGLSLAIFLFYWISLVQGEKLADRDVVSPWLGMWAANIGIALIGLGLTVYKVIDHRVLALLHRLKDRLSGLFRNP